MIPHIRKRFNEAFNTENYNAFYQTLSDTFGESPNFKVAETPVFIPKDLEGKLLNTSEEISRFITRPDFKDLSAPAIRLPELLVPNEDDRPLFLQFDYAITRTEEGELEPQLIEMQGFPSLYFYQHLLALNYRRYFDIPAHFDHLFSGLNLVSYVKLLREVIVGEHHPRNVILLEVEPEKQNTRIDFWGAEQVLGIKVLCLSKLIREGRSLYYIDDQGRKVGVHRIFNRVIFDELMRRPDLSRSFNLTEEVDVEWAGHPNWFMRISKYTMPFLKGRYIPESYFLHQLDQYPENLFDYVLKPLYSFSGKGVELNLTREGLDRIPDRENYILQRKISYSEVVESPYQTPASKCEVRMMMVWKSGWEQPRMTINLVRLSRGAMIGVRYNTDDRWVGASIGFFDRS